MMGCGNILQKNTGECIIFILIDLLTYLFVMFTEYLLCAWCCFRVRDTDINKIDYSPYFHRVNSSGGTGEGQCGLSDGNKTEWDRKPCTYAHIWKSTISDITDKLKRCNIKGV